MNIKKIIGLTLFTSLIIFGSAKIYYNLTDDFRISNMTYELPHNKDWDIPGISSYENELLNEVLNQKFYYLGKGAQSYVFTSEDGLTVIKFFKFKHLKPSIFLNSLSHIPLFSKYAKKEIARKNKKLNSAFNGYRLAYEIHKQESGLIYLHLNKTSDIQKTLTIIDKIGLSHEIDLDQNVFLVQRKGETLETVLRELLNQNNLSLAKSRLRQILDLYLSEYQKGAYDHDHRVMNNTGFVDQEPIHLDVGHFSLEESMKDKAVFQKDFAIIIGKIDLWLKKNFPKHQEEIVKDLESLNAQFVF